MLRLRLGGGPSHLIPARSDHPVGCHAARNSRRVALRVHRGERRASQQHGPRRAPPAPSLLTPNAIDNVYAYAVLLSLRTPAVVPPDKYQATIEECREGSATRRAC